MGCNQWRLYRFIGDKRPIAEAGVSDTICGDTYHLHAAPSTITGITGIWRNISNTTFASTGTSYGTNFEDTVTALLGTYEFIWFEQVDSLLGCGDADTIEILFAGEPTGTIEDTILALCVGESFEFIAESVHANPTIYYWDTEFDDPGVIDTSTYGASHAIISWPNSEQPDHSVELITENLHGCKSQIRTILVFEPPALEPEFTQDEATCGDSTGIAYLQKYLDENNLHYYQFKWIDTLSNGTLMFPLLTDPLSPSIDTTQINLYPGDYTVIVSGEQRADPFLTYQHICKDTLTITIDDSGDIIANIDTNISDGIVPYNLPLITYNTDPSTDYIWDIYNIETGESIFTTEEALDTVTFTEEGDYSIRYIVESREGCFDTLYYSTIHVDAASLLEVPNIFTPNGDGINDEFYVKHETLLDFHGTIVNRWGKKVYEWTDPNGGWNGQIQGSKGESPAGVYYYFIKATGKDEKVYEQKGVFHLIRTK